MNSTTRPNPWLEIVTTIVVPSVVLMYASGDAALGPTVALVVALAFPLLWGLNSWRQARGFGAMAGIGVVSTVLTGGMGLLQLDGSWFAVKEAAVSALFGLAVAVSALSRRPLIHALLLHPSVFDVPRLQAALTQRGTAEAFAGRMRRATLLLALTFGVSAVLNYLLARWLVASPSGSEAFNEELGRFTLVAWPVITVPSLAMTMALLWWIARGIRELADLSFNDLLLAGQPSHG